MPIFLLAIFNIVNLIMPKYFADKLIISSKIMNSNVVQSSSYTAEYNNSVFQESNKLYVSPGRHISIYNVDKYAILELAPKSGIFLKSNGVHILNKDQFNTKTISAESLDKQFKYDKSLCFNLMHTDNNVEVSGDITFSAES